MHQCECDILQPVFHLGDFPVCKPNDWNIKSLCSQHSLPSPPQKKSAEHKKLDTKDHIRYDYIYIQN